MQIGSAMREARKNRGLTQVELAEIAGMAVNSIRLYESGKRIPSIDQRIKIADKLDCSPFDFMTEGEAEAFSEHFMLGYWSREEEFHDELEFATKELEARKNDFLYSNMITSYKKLNADGKIEAAKRVDELTQIPKYQRTAPEEPLAEADTNTDTPEKEKPPEGPNNPADGK